MEMTELVALVQAAGTGGVGLLIVVVYLLRRDIKALRGQLDECLQSGGKIEKDAVDDTVF